MNAPDTLTPIASGEAAPRDIAFDDRAVYWVNEGKYDAPSSAGAIRRAPR